MLQLRMCDENLDGREEEVEMEAKVGSLIFARGTNLLADHVLFQMVKCRSGHYFHHPIYLVADLVAVCGCHLLSPDAPKRQVAFYVPKLYFGMTIHISARS